jgi:hypothetical protein
LIKEGIGGGVHLAVGKELTDLKPETPNWVKIPFTLSAAGHYRGGLIRQAKPRYGNKCLQTNYKLIF